MLTYSPSLSLSLSRVPLGVPLGSIQQTNTNFRKSLVAIATKPPGMLPDNRRWHFKERAMTLCFYFWGYVFPLFLVPFSSLLSAPTSHMIYVREHSLLRVGLCTSFFAELKPFLSLLRLHGPELRL